MTDISMQGMEWKKEDMRAEFSFSLSLPLVQSLLSKRAFTHPHPPFLFFCLFFCS
jgi:hypothetical protein